MNILLRLVIESINNGEDLVIGSDERSCFMVKIGDFWFDGSFYSYQDALENAFVYYMKFLGANESKKEE